MRIMDVTFALVVFAAAASGAVAQEKELYFEPPAGANDKDRTQAAKALAARCVAAGLRDVKAETVRRTPDSPRLIRLQSANGFSKEQIEHVEFLASWPCKSVQMRLERFLAQDEKDKFPAGEQAPKGTTWTKQRSWVLTEKPFPHYMQKDEEEDVLFLDKPVIDASGRWGFLRHRGGDLHGQECKEGVYLTFKGPVVKAMYDSIVPDPDKPAKKMLPLHLFFDGVRIPTDGGRMGWRVIQPKAKDPDFALWTFPDLTEQSPLAYLLEYPLPFILKRTP